MDADGVRWFDGLHLFINQTVALYKNYIKMLKDVCTVFAELTSGDWFHRVTTHVQTMYDDTETFVAALVVHSGVSSVYCFASC